MERMGRESGNSNEVTVGWRVNTGVVLTEENWKMGLKDVFRYKSQ